MDTNQAFNILSKKKLTPNQGVVDASPETQNDPIVKKTLRSIKDKLSTRLLGGKETSISKDFKTITDATMTFGQSALRTAGTLLGDIQDVQEGVLENTLGKLIDRATGVERRQPQTMNIRDITDKAVSWMEENTNTADFKKTYTGQIIDALGSSLPYMAGGAALKTLGVGSKAAAFGMAGLEALQNSSQDYRDLIDQGMTKKEAFARSVGSYGGNLALNYITNKLGGFYENPNLKKGLYQALKTWFGVTGAETVQEVGQTFVSNIATGRPLSTGIAETFSVALPVSAIFGAVGSSTNARLAANFRNMTESFTTELSKSGASKEQVAELISQFNGVPKNTVIKAIDEYIADKPEIQKSFIDNEKNQVTSIVDNAIQNVADQEMPSFLAKETVPQEDELMKEARKYKSAEEFVKAQGQSVFRGGDNAIDVSRGNGRGISVSDKETAGLFTPPKGGVIDEAILPKTAKILKEGDIPKNLQDVYIKEAKVLANPNNFSTTLQKSVIEKQQAIVDYARKNGFDAVEFPFEKEIRIVKPDILKTKSQLEEIWKKANTQDKGEVPPIETSGQMFEDKIQPMFSLMEEDKPENITQEDWDTLVKISEERVKLPEVQVSTRRVAQYLNRLKIKAKDPVLLRYIIGPDGKNAYGVFYRGRIAFTDIVQQFTEDHEVFHLIFQNMKRIPSFKGFTYQELFNEAREIYGKSLTARQLEEQMAIDFQQYVYQREYNKPTTFSGKVALFFNDLYEFFKSIFGTNKDIKDFYRTMYQARANQNTYIMDTTSEQFIDDVVDQKLDFREYEDVMNAMRQAMFNVKDSGYIENGELTLKTLKKLEGRTTVSKQFIEDLTNAGDIKQVERDLIREMLQGEGTTINVADFAKKVKAELLPLKTKDVGSNFESITLPDDLRGDVQNYNVNVYESPIKTSAGKVHFSDVTDAMGGSDVDNYFGHTRIEDMADNKTRRVIEVQSDLYQKGNLEREGVRMLNITDDQLKSALSPKEYTELKGLKDKFSSSNDVDTNLALERRQIELFEKAKANLPRTKEIAKLQQYNNPTAHFRMVREEIKKAAQDGKTKLQFPTGETAMKIEGLGENAMRFYEPGNPTVLDYNQMTVGKEVQPLSHRNQGQGSWIITEVLGDGKFKAVPQRKSAGFVVKDGKLVEQYAQNGETKYMDIDPNWIETFDISGKVDTNNPIYKFYEKDLGRYLTNNYAAKPITDQNGVTWYEVDITDEYIAPVVAFNTAPGTPEGDMNELQNILKNAEKKAAHLGFKKERPVSGPINLTQAVDVVHEVDSYDDFIATLRGGDDAVQPFYAEDQEIVVTNKYYDQVLTEIKEYGYQSLEQFYNENKRVPIQRMQNIQKTIDRVVNRGILTKQETEEVLDPVKVEKLRSKPTTKIELTPELQTQKEEIQMYSYLIDEATLTVKNHPGKKLKRFFREGVFMDFRNPDLAKTPSEKKRIEETNKRIVKATELAFADTPYSDRYDDPDTIREVIEDYDTQYKRLVELKQTRTEKRKEFYKARNAFYLEERDRIALDSLVDKEEKVKVLDQVLAILRQEGRSRWNAIEELADRFAVPDSAIKKMIGRKNLNIMSDSEWNIFLSEMVDMVHQYNKTALARAEVEATIAQKELKKTENLLQAMGLSQDLSKLDEQTLLKLNELLGTFETGDVFLGVREIETLAKNTPLKDVKTKRQIIEKVITQKTGIPASQIRDIVVKYTDMIASPASLAGKNLFYQIMVNDARQMMTNADIKIAEMRIKTNELAKAARKSRTRRLVDRLVPTDELVIKYLEEEDLEVKTQIANTMTREELAFAHYLRDSYQKARDYLVQQEVLKRYRENYYTHRPRGFLEALLKGGYTDVVESVDGTTKTKKTNPLRIIARALKETIVDVHKMDQVAFNILSEQTQNVLPLEKFFKYSMQRSENLIPTKNAASAFMGYMAALEKKKALDEYIPTIEAAARALTTEEETERGLIKDPTLLNFVRKWINTQKGRYIDFSGALRQGDTPDAAIRSMVTFIRFLDLGLRLPVQAASMVGEQMVTYVNIGASRYAKGIVRSTTKQGMDIVKDYEGFIQESLWQSLQDQSKDAGARFAEIMFGFYRVSARKADIIHFLGSLTEQEFKTGEVSDQRLAEIEQEMALYRPDKSLKGILAATSIGNAFRQHRGWAIPLISRTYGNMLELRKIATDEKIDPKRMNELKRMVLATLIAYIIRSAFKDLEDKKDKNFLETLADRSMRDAMSFIDALKPTTWSNSARITSWIQGMFESVQTLVQSVATGERDSEGSIKGVSGLKQALIPRMVRGSGLSKAERIKEQISTTYMAGDRTKANEMLRKAKEDKVLTKQQANTLVTNLKKQQKIDELFTTRREKRWVDTYEKAQTTAQKAEVLMNAKRRMTPEQFKDFTQKGRSTITTSSGNKIRILITDPVKDEYMKLKNAGT